MEKVRSELHARVRVLLLTVLMAAVWLVLGMVYPDRFVPHLDRLELVLMPWRRPMPPEANLSQRLSLMQDHLDAATRVSSYAFFSMIAPFAALSVYLSILYQQKQRARVRVSCAMDSDGGRQYVTVSVRDEGKGMDEQQADQCFYKGKGSRDSWGQGLYFAKYVVGLHAGKIRIGKEYTAPGEGGEGGAGHHTENDALNAQREARGRAEEGACLEAAEQAGEAGAGQGVEEAALRLPWPQEGCGQGGWIIAFIGQRVEGKRRRRKELVLLF